MVSMETPQAIPLESKLGAILLLLKNRVDSCQNEIGVGQSIARDYEQALGRNPMDTGAARKLLLAADEIRQAQTLLRVYESFRLALRDLFPDAGIKPLLCDSCGVLLKEGVRCH